MNYIPHNLIKDIYSRIDIANNPYTRINLKDGSEYNCKGSITIDTSGIMGIFTINKS